MTFISQYMLHHVTIAIFLCLALGYLLGRLRYKTLVVGATVGTLLVGLLIGHLGKFEIDGNIKTIFFSLFIFTIGYEVGPSFFRSLKSSGIKVVLQSVFFAAAALGVAMACFKIFNIQPGEAAGIIAGALTQSAIIGTAATAISDLSISASMQQQMQSQVAVAYALTYVLGTVGVIILLKNIAPKLLGADLRAETKAMIEKHNYHGDTPLSTAVSPTKLRSFIVEKGSSYIGQSVAQLEAQFQDQIIVEGLYRNNSSVAFSLATKITADNIILVIGDLSDMVQLEGNGLTETFDEKYQSVDLQQVDVMLTRVFRRDHLKDLYANNIVIVSDKCEGNAVSDRNDMQAGDTLTLIGPKRSIEKVVHEFGYPKQVGSDTDVSFLSAGIVLGLIVGAITLGSASIPITLGGGGGALLMGLLMGWYRDKHPHFGLIPAPTRWFLKSVGLNLFIAIVGIEAGASFIPALQSMGYMVLVIGLIVSIVPHILSIFFAKYALRMNAVDIIGGQCGAGTITAGLNAVNEEYGTSIFALSYTPGYAVGNILLTLMGPIVIAFL
ncbi:aspartate-alanine antiporter [Desulforhopalus vacuolatus]|uniref:aspartate-alanine antiporter n=1 Tax=Desulforhopalus vacuolatus TaxID=40414 RepID=UPI001962A019|nr:aspartate-alanine antiporter [Desulforhopalus vacuolatus]MBM9519594.1 aspartate-alanine antiporter [Desulforhopalus vacuolatus]